MDHLWSALAPVGGAGLPAFRKRSPGPGPDPLGTALQHCGPSSGSSPSSLGLVLYLIAHSTGVRQAQQHPSGTRVSVDSSASDRAELEEARPVRPTCSRRIPGRRTPNRAPGFQRARVQQPPTPHGTGVADPSRHRCAGQPGRTRRRHGTPTRAGDSTTGGGTVISGRPRSRPMGTI